MSQPGGLRAFRVLDHQRHRLELGGSYVITDAAKQSSVSISEGLEDWLCAENVSLAFSTLDCGALFLLGRTGSGGLLISQYGVDHSTGIALDSNCLLLGTRKKVVRFHWDRQRDGDDMYTPVVSHMLGPTDIHEIVIDRNGEALVVDSAYSCVMRLNAIRGAAITWKPAFITALKPEDRCHLNGIALDNGVPRFVTTFCRSDTASGWRNLPVDQGAVLAMEDGRAVVEGLVKPHSPRMHEGFLYFLDSGRGTVMRAHPNGGENERVAFLPGFLRGLSFHGRYAAITSSRPRDLNFAGLPLNDALRDAGVQPAAGVFILDLVSGKVLHSIQFQSGSEELFDVVFLVDVTTPRFRAGTFQP